MPEGLSDMLNEAVEASLEDVEVDEVGGEVDNSDDGADEYDEDTQEDEVDSDDEDNSDDYLGEDDEEMVDSSADEDDFDFNDFLERYGDRTVTLTVQGEPVEVKVADLPNGYMMREDYSRKTAAVAEKERFANWAQDVQYAFANDPLGTLDAFAQAYGIQLPMDGQAGQPVQDDPYEDLDPDVAAVLRKMDEQEQRHEAELARVRQTVDQMTNQQLVEDVKAEVLQLREEFGEDLNTTQMLQYAAQYNMPLRQAAETVVGRQYFAKSKEQLAAEAEAREVTQKRTDQSRSKSKKRAASTATKKFDASDVSVDDFSTISELFEIELNSAS